MGKTQAHKGRIKRSRVVVRRKVKEETQQVK